MKLRWTRLALQDLRHLYEYIAEDRPQAAGEMIARIQQAAHHLPKHPRMGKAGRLAGTRELVIAQTPYIVVYVITENEIHIVAILHTAMRWPDALPSENF